MRASLFMHMWFRWRFTSLMNTPNFQVTCSLLYKCSLLGVNWLMISFHFLHHMKCCQIINTEVLYTVLSVLFLPAPSLGLTWAFRGQQKLFSVLYWLYRQGQNVLGSVSICQAAFLWPLTNSTWYCILQAHENDRMCNAVSLHQALASSEGARVQFWHVLADTTKFCTCCACFCVCCCWTYV